LKSLLIIFYRNPELGKVKTRLAKTIGDEKALAIYFTLASHTRKITEELIVDKIVYYSDFIDTEDTWPNTVFKKQLQQGYVLGEKMLYAFEEGFRKGYQHICIIGTDCLELEAEIIAQAFEQLTSYDAVLGPAKDGGYYLLGMNQLIHEVFRNKEWSTDSVAASTILDFKNKNLSYSLLTTLTDVDEEPDLPPHWQL
jgi:hypothetical protein